MKPKINLSWAEFLENLTPEEAQELREMELREKANSIELLEITREIKKQAEEVAKNDPSEEEFAKLAKIKVSTLQDPKEIQEYKDLLSRNLDRALKKSDKAAKLQERLDKNVAEFDELQNMNDDFIKRVDERRCTEIIKQVGIVKFFKLRKQEWEEALEEIRQDQVKPKKERKYANNWADTATQAFNKQINVCNEALNKLKEAKEKDFKDLSYPEIIEALSKMEIEVDRLLKDYSVLPTSPVTEFIKKTFIYMGGIVPMNKNIKLKRSVNLESGGIEYNYSNKQENYVVYFENPKILESQKNNLAFRKALNFMLIKSNEQNNPTHIYFDLEEYQNMNGYKSKDTAYRAAKKNLDALRTISVGGVIERGGKEIRNKTSYVFIAKDVSYNQCYVECKPEYIQMLSQYFSILPKWAGELNTKAYDLLDYIFLMARQKQNIAKIQAESSFNISLKSINERIGGHKPEETTRHTEYIIDPLLNAIEEIEEKQRGERIYITPIFPEGEYKNGYDFLEGYLQIELGEEARKYFCLRNEAREEAIGKQIKRSLKK